MFEKLLKKEAAPEKEVKKEEETLFKIELQHEIPTLPDFKTKEETDIRYPLIEPYAYAHIFWDPEKQEVIYKIEEPELNPREKEILRILEDGVKELINISFISMKEGDVVVRYLEKNLKVLLRELGFTLSKDTFLKIMYYIYRDFVGLNEIEPLMNDYFIEDIECNGIQTPLYIIHRKYRNIKTNIEFDNVLYLASFVEKLAQKCGRYVSYASPLLDGSLPSGHRVNATYTADVSSRGPTFTLRAFTKEPWSPPKLIELGTVSPEMLAYLWILVENELNVMVIGGTGSGKTSFLNCIAFFIPQQARIVSIEDTKELNLAHENWLPSVAREGTGLANIVGQKYGEVTLFDLLKESFRQRPDYVIVGEVRGSVSGDEEIFTVENGLTRRIPIKDLENRDISKIKVLTLDKNNKINLHNIKKFIKHFKRDKLIEVVTKTGRKIKITKDHSLFTSSGFNVVPVEGNNLKVGDSVLIPSKTPCGYNDMDKINLFELLDDARVASAQGFVKKAISKIGQGNANRLLGCVARQYCRLKQKSNIPIKLFKKLMNEASLDYGIQNQRIKNGNSKEFNAIMKIDEDFCRFLGYYVSEGHIQNQGRDIVITNSNKKIREDVFRISKRLFGIIPKVRKVTGFGSSYHFIIRSAILARIIKRIGCGTKEKRVPPFIYGLSKSKICSFLKGLYSGDGNFYKNEVSFASKSEKLSEDVSYLLLSLGIVSRIEKSKNKNLVRVRFKRIEDSELFLNEVGFIHKTYSVIQKGCTHSNSNIIHFNPEDINFKLSRRYRHLKRFGRCSKFYLKNITENLKLNNNISKFADGDFYLDKIKQINPVESSDKYVYDISVNPTESFVGGFGGIILHNSEAFVLFQGMASIPGNEEIFILNDNKLKKIKIKDIEGNTKKYKIITINPNTLKLEISPIKNFFKHKPRKILYKIETEKGKEITTTGDHSVFIYTNKIIPMAVKDLKKGDSIASVDIKSDIRKSNIISEKIKSIKKIKLERPESVYDISVQGTQNFVSGSSILLHNSGHPSLGTMHANDVQTMIRRLETPPINLSPSLVESMDAVCIMSQAKYKGKEVRRLKQIAEIISVPEDVGKAQMNTPFQWDSRTDTFYFKTDSYIFQKLVSQHGYSQEHLVQEFDYRTKLLYELYKRKIFEFREVQKIIHEYARNPKKVLKDYGIIK